MLRPARATVIALCAYLLLGIAVLGLFRGQYNADLLSYIGVARRYLAGDLQGAINGYWSPLLSWLLVPLLALHTPPLLAAKLLGLGAGAATLLALEQVCRRLAAPERVIAAVAVACVPMLLEFALLVPACDLLAAAIVACYLALSLDPQRLDLRHAAACGAAGALGYLTKNYVFGFFVVHFAVLHLVRMLRQPDRRRAWLRHGAAGMATFAAITALWIVPISVKYGHATIGTAGDYNHRWQGPGQGIAPVYKHLLAPHDAQAASAWEDPTWHADLVPRWSPLASRDNLLHQLRIIGRMARRAAEFFLGAGPALLPTLLAALYVLWRRRDRPPALTGLTWAALAYPLGYLPIALDARYIWPTVLVFVCIGAALLPTLLPARPRAQLAALALFALSFWPWPLDHLAIKLHTQHEIHEAADGLRARGGLHGNVASIGNLWLESAGLCFDLGCRYFGEPAADTPVQDLARQLAALDVRHLLVWQLPGYPPPPPLPPQFSEEAVLPVLRVYSVSR